MVVVALHIIPIPNPHDNRRRIPSNITHKIPSPFPISPTYDVPPKQLYQPLRTLHQIIHKHPRLMLLHAPVILRRALIERLLHEPAVRLAALVVRDVEHALGAVHQRPRHHRERAVAVVRGSFVEEVFGDGARVDDHHAPAEDVE